MKCVLLISLAALSCAVPLTPDGPRVIFEENDSIAIAGYDGQQLLISKTIKNDGSNYIEISVTDLEGRTNTFRVDQDNNLRFVKVQDPVVGDFNVIDRTKKLEESRKDIIESDILKEVFREFRNAVGLKAYENVLRKIDSYIRTGDLHSSIFEVLRSFAKYEAVKPEGSYPNYLNTAIDEQQRENYGVRQPKSELLRGSIYNFRNPFLYRSVPVTSQRIVQWPQYGVQGKNLQQYSNSYGQIKQQLAPVQSSKQTLQPSSRLYQQEVSQPLQLWNLPQSLWTLPKQQLAQEQLLWNQEQAQQQLVVPQQLPQEQQIQPQGVLTQPQDQLNFLGQDWALPKRQWLQGLPWNRVQEQQQYYEPQQQWIESQQQKELVQQQYLRPQQPYAEYIAAGDQLPRSLEGYLWNQNLWNRNLWSQQQVIAPQQQWVRSQISQPQLNFVDQQVRPLGQQWAVSNQQERLGLPVGQQTQRTILPEYYWQNPVSAQYVDEVSPNVFYNYNWNENLKPLAFSIRMIIMRGQQSINIRIGKFSRIDFQTCLATIKTAVSYYMFLRTVGEKYRGSSSQMIK